MKVNKIQINTNTQKYPIIIGKDLIKSLDKILKENSFKFNQCLLVVDKKIKNKKVKSIIKFLKIKKIFVHYFKSSEINKNQKSVNNILNILLKKNFNRNDCLISIGGGITGDVSGYASSIFKRGLKFINIPTTLLSQVDSSIGGKTGINTKYGKNSVGTFYQPSLVISDINFLKTLPKREIICGYGEILKHSLIANKTFFKYLDENFLNILNLKSPSIERAIYESCIIKKKIVEKDERETGLRKMLNVGHTFAHAFEASSGYSKKLNHGEAVILGIKTASRFSFLNKFLSKKDLNLILNHINKANLPHNLSKFFSINSSKKILSFMIKDKKNSSKKISLVLIKKIGYTLINKSYNKASIALFLKKELTD